MYDGARVPSPPDGANGLPHPGTSASRPRPEEGLQGSETVLVKKAHREILDHERKRRVELKCMELQEMMEEEGYSEEEIKQKVDTFRQMLMEKEGVITRVDSCRHPVVTHDPQDTEADRECPLPTEGAMAECDCHVDSCETNSVSHSNYSPQAHMKRKSCCSTSPPPRKKKKKKNSRCKERKRRSGRKHKRCRSLSGSRKKRRHRSGSPKNTNKGKYKHRKMSPVYSPCRRSHHRGTSCSSRSASADRRSPPCSRPISKHRADGRKSSSSSSDSNCSPSTSLSQSPSRSTDPAKAWHNGHQDGGRNSQDGDPDQARGHKAQDNEPITAHLDPRASLSPRLKDTGVAAGSPVPTGEPTCGDGNHRSVRSPSVYPVKGRGRPGVERRSHSPARSSDSLPSHHSQAQRKKDTRQKKAKGSRSSRKHHRRRARNRHQSSSRSPARRSRHADGGRKCQSHGTRQRSSPGSCSRSASRERDSQTKSPHSRQNSTSQTKSPHSRQNSTREKDSDGRTPHTDTESRAHQRSRSYSPIRKRRSDSPSFMEARRITSARKRPIPYYRPSPSSPSSLSSCSAVRRYSRSRSRSRSWSSRSPSRNHSYYSRGSSESLAF